MNYRSALALATMTLLASAAFVPAIAADVTPERLAKLDGYPSDAARYVTCNFEREDPIDYVQRQMLQRASELHPLVERISRIHVTEEARHMAFARHFLRRTVPRLRGIKLFGLRLRTAVVMKVASLMMTRPSGHVIRTYGIPASVLAEAYGPGSPSEERIKRALFKPRELCWELGVLNARWAWLWQRLRIYAPQGTPS